MIPGCKLAINTDSKFLGWWMAMGSRVPACRQGAAGVRGGQFIARLRALRHLPGFDLEAVARMEGRGTAG